MTTQTTTRRTKRDVEYLADAYTVGAGGFDPTVGDDPKRNSRLRDHGWLTAQGSLTGNGERIAATARVLRRRDVFDVTVDIVGGIPNFVDAATDTNAEDAVAYFAGIRTAYNLIDESRNVADTDADEFDALADHFADFDGRLGRVELRFEREQTATAFRVDFAPDRFDVERKHDERFGDNRNPRRLVVTVA